MRNYFPRIVDELLRQQLAIGAVLIEGIRWCGKTWTAEQYSNSKLLMNDPEHQEQNISLAENSPQLALEGETPRLIDEWQMVPKLWDAVRFEVDKRDKPEQFILTGSAVPPDISKIHHTGTGRIAKLLMRPMSLYESQESTGEISLKELFESPDTIKGSSSLGLRDIAFLSCRGGWPKAVKSTGNTALNLSNIYFDGIIESDISRADGVRRNSQIAKSILRSYARNIGQQSPLEQIRLDIEQSEGKYISIDTIYSYINALREIYAIEESPAWNPNLRSKTAIRTTNTRYFVDSSIATSALGLNTEDLINDLRTFGFIFENLCIRDLRIYAEANGGEVSHFRDSNGLECDAVIHSKNGNFGLVEIKLGSNDEVIADAAKKLKSLSQNLTKQPSFQMILCGNCPFAYRREDGIYIVPIACLKP